MPRGSLPPLPRAYRADRHFSSKIAPTDTTPAFLHTRAASDMSSTRERRIAKELADIHNDKDNSGVMAQPIDPSNLTHLKGTFPGPPDSPYAGGTYQVDIKIPDNYPFKSPIMKFDTKMWHPNVSSVTVSPSPPAPAFL